MAMQHRAVAHTRAQQQCGVPRLAEAARELGARVLQICLGAITGTGRVNHVVESSASASRPPYMPPRGPCCSCTPLLSTLARLTPDAADPHRCQQTTRPCGPRMFLICPPPPSVRMLFGPCLASRRSAGVLKLRRLLCSWLPAFRKASREPSAPQQILVLLHDALSGVRFRHHELAASLRTGSPAALALRARSASAGTGPASKCCGAPRSGA